MSRFIKAILAGDDATVTYTNVHGATDEVNGTIINADARGVAIMDHAGKSHYIEWRNVHEDGFKHQPPPVDDPARYNKSLL